MQLTRNTLSPAIFFILCFTGLSGYAQLGFSFDIKKPRVYDDRVLGSEKSENKKFSLPRRFIHNTFTHHNYFFNANNKLNEILGLAKSQHIDDYTELLSFYNYSLDVTARNKTQLDSVIYKSTTGIVLHDLRNDWVDNLYLLTGAAYYLSKQFDSAYLTFQFINYAFADKEKDGYYKTIGSHLDGNKAFSISSKEKKNLPRRVFTKPPSRNEAFIWLIRTLIAQEEYAESASLIVTLKNDPNFPKRLKNDLEEVQALWFYNNNMHDSAALHLSHALGKAPTKSERTRWEFLTAQLYEISGKPDLAKSFYEKAVSHTTDPVMEIYARLYSIRINKDGAENYIDRNIAELLKMARRDKYTDYRDVIYYTLAQMETERGNLAAAQFYLGKSAEFNTTNTTLKNKAWLQLAAIAFTHKKYRVARNCYDSLDFSDPSLKNRESLISKKEFLQKIATQIEVIERQDSLQRIAALPEGERKDLVRKITRQLRKEQGLKDEQVTLVPIGINAQTIPSDLFNTNSSKGEWYFYNASLRSKGLNEFKAKWGNRTNADNWRRSAAFGITQNTKLPNATDTVTKTTASLQAGEISFETLYENLPLTDELMKISNDSVSAAMYVLGKAFAEEVEDCSSSIQTLEELRNRFPQHKKMDEVLFTLFYCYNKNGQTDKATAIKKLMEEKFAGNPLTTIVSTGQDPRNKASNPDATKTYEHIYDLFIEGNFAQAIAQKAKADSSYGSDFWTPQLLYIESVYFIKQKQDDKAVESLAKIVQTFPATPMAEKATTLTDVLTRRQQIENELRNLNVERPKDAAIKKTDTVIAVIPPKADTVITKPAQQIIQPVISSPVVIKKDSMISKPAIAPFIFKPIDKYSVMILLNKVDLVWANEAKNAFNIYNRGKYYNKQFVLSITDINGEYRGLLIGTFDDAQTALEYMQAAKSVSFTQIIPWLKSDKYSFTIISIENLELLKSMKDVNSYKQFIEKNLPGKF